MGNPARVIYTLEEFTEKRKIRFIAEAKDMAKMYYRQYSKWPEKSLFIENFWVFEDSYNNLDEEFKGVFQWVDGKTEKSIEKFNEYTSSLASYEEFIHQCEHEIEKEREVQ